MNAEAPSASRELTAYDRDTRQLLFFARLSFVMVGTAPFWIPLIKPWLGAAGQALDGLFVLVCHRLPSRTLTLAGELMPVCSRCAGIFGGLALGILVAWPKLTLRQARIALGMAALLMLADVLMQDFGLHPMWHASRLATGGLLGYLASAALVAAILRERRAQAPARR